jgi:hypothetical protein
MSWGAGNGSVCDLPLVDGAIQVEAEEAEVLPVDQDHAVVPVAAHDLDQRSDHGPCVDGEAVADGERELEALDPVPSSLHIDGHTLVGLVEIGIDPAVEAGEGLAERLPVLAFAVAVELLVAGLLLVQEDR